MIRTLALVSAVGLDPSGQRTATLHCPPAALPSAGQAVLAAPRLALAAMPFSLYPIQLDSKGFRSRVPMGQRWLPGDEIDLVGPIGRGFAPPDGSARWLLISAEGGPGPLMPLVETALAAEAAVALVCPNPPDELPADVELLPTAEEAVDWADYLAIDLGTRGIADLRRLVGLESPFDPGCTTEILLPWTLPCGFGGCLSCGLPTRDGWRLACQYGPVFQWGELRV